MNKPIFALVDCNNFFVSCERVFRPDLETTPVVVLSSNDGCAVARSNEVKALGVPMGAPAFKYQTLFNKHGVVKFSANFELYSDISRRISNILIGFTPRLEIYSIDEAFLDLSELRIKNYEEWGRAVRQEIMNCTGVPVSVGIAKSKTLAKLASARAKKDSSLNGVLFLGESNTTQHLSATSVQDIWGIGRRLAPKVRIEGVGNALQCSLLKPRRAQQLLGINGRKLVAELNGISCYPLELEHQKPKTIARTRTFGEDTNQLGVVEAALASFVSAASFSLRRSNQLASRVGFFVTTSRYKPAYKYWAKELNYQNPTADTGHIMADVLAMFRSLYSPTVQYHRAGVVFGNFVPDDQFQVDLLNSREVAKYQRSMDLMRAFDGLNERYGKQTIYYASEELKTSWKPRRRLQSPRYTTNLLELPFVQIKT